MLTAEEIESVKPSNELKYIMNRITDDAKDGHFSTQYSITYREINIPKLKELGYQVQGPDLGRFIISWK